MSHVIEIFRLICEWASLGIELLAVVVIVVEVVILGLQHGTVRYLLRLGNPSAHEGYRHQMGKGLLLGLNLLMAADVIRTVALDATIRNVAVLGLLVVVRTFLSWSLSVEIHGRWPWQGRAASEVEIPPSNGA
jgi:uncharacterized membrane protein